MSRILIMTAIIILTITIISSSSLTNVLAKAKVTKGPIECEKVIDYTTHDYNGQIECCQTETDSKGVEIKYCTVCDDTAPPSNCSPREQVREIKSLLSDLPAVERNPTVSPPRDHPPLATENLQQLPTTTLQQQTELCPAGSAPDAKGNCSNVENNIQPSTSSDNKQLKGESELEENIKNENNPNNQQFNSDDNQNDNDPGQTETPEEISTTN